MTTNPLLAEPKLPYGFPPFDEIKPEHFIPAFETAMKEHLEQVEAVALNPQEPTFENTLVAMEKSGERFSRVASIFFNLAHAHTNDALKAVEAEMAPRIAKHNDDISLNPKLFERVKKLNEKKASLGLDPESDRLLWQYNEDFVRAGAQLNAEDQAALRTLNTELATLYTQFGQYLMKEVGDSAVWFDDVSELAGMSQDALEAAETAANAVEADKRKGKYLVKLINTTGQPCLDSLTNPASRKKVLEASLARGSRGGPYDARELVLQITTKRILRAKLLGYPNHSSFQLADQTIGGVERANKLLRDLAPAAVRNARAEHAKLQELANEQTPGFEVTAADWDLYSEQVRKRDYSFDESSLKPYFELNRVFEDGLLFAASRLYGLKFVQRTDLPVYEPSVKVYNVLEEDGTTLVAIFVIDFYARESKRGGAWMNQYQAQSDLLGSLPIIGNHLNVPRPTGDGPALLTFDEVRTLFHEFGHALHGMLSKVKYPRFSGTNVPTDFVEFPSQVNEMWATFPDVINNYAKHYQTGEPIPQVLIEKFKAAERFNEGYRTTEFLAAALLDQAYHQLTTPLASVDDILPFEAAALRDVGLDFAPVPPRYRSTYFAHVFSTNSYAAKYCGYLWSEVLDAHAADWIRKNGGLTRENGDKLRRCVLSRGGSSDPLGLFESFVGAGPDIKPLLERRGLTV